MLSVRRQEGVTDVTWIHLRREPATLSFDEGRKVFGLEMWTNGNFSELWRPTSYIQYPVFAERFRQSDAAVLDMITGLMWQRSANVGLPYEKAAMSVQELNERSLAGHRDWRMPTVPEFMSLLRLDESCSSGGEFIDRVFGWSQHSYWTADRCPSGAAWHVNCAILDIGPLDVGHQLFVRAVRSHVSADYPIDQ
jgi:hypothetical protein